MIKGNGGKKHLEHICNATDIPAAYILIEGNGVSKHTIHICNAADIPTADILIEASLAKKHPKHIGNVAGAASGSNGVVRFDLVNRPFGIFNTTYCADIANCGIGTANSYAIAMEEKGFSWAWGIWVCCLSTASTAAVIVTGTMRKA